MTSTDILPENLNAAEKRMLRRYETEAETALKSIDSSAADLGRALRDIQEEKLYRATGTFKEYVQTRFGVSKSTAYRCIQLWEWKSANPTLPIPKLWELEPAKVAAKTVPKRPTDGTAADGQPPTVTDADWSEEVPVPVAIGPAPAPDVESEAPDTASADSPGATLRGQSEVRPELTAPGGEAEDYPVAVVYSPIPADANPPGFPVAVETTADGDESEQWTPVREFPTDESGQLVSLGGTPIPEPVFEVPTDEERTQAAVVALFRLLESADLDALGASMTDDQVDTVMVAAETIRDAHAIATKPREKLSKGQRAKASAKATAPVVAKSDGGLGRREVEPMFKTAKAAAK
jgi:hypothetical protein